MTARQTAESSPLKRQLLSYEKNTSPRLAPDGRSIVFVRTIDDGQELWLRAFDGHEQQLAVHRGEMVGDLRWTADSSMLLYRHAQRGREHWQLAGLRIADLGHFEVAAPGPVTEYWLAQSDPAAVVLCSRIPGSPRSGLFRVDLAAGSDNDPTLIAPSPGYHRWLVDGELRPRGGIRLVAGGAAEVFLGDSLEVARSVLLIAVDEVVDLSAQGFSQAGNQLFLLTSWGAKTRRLIAIESSSGAISTVFQDPHRDIESYPIGGQGVWFDPGTGRPDICAVMDQRLRYHPLTKDQRRAVASLAATDDDSALILDRSADDQTWLIVYVRDNAPLDYHLFYPETGQSVLLFVNRPELAGYVLPRLEDFFYTASDGVPLSGYAMRPLKHEPPFPTVVMVHGGPAGRDYWRFYADAQYLASLGYLSLHINYRGSSGFGADFRLAGNGEWGGRMQQDLYDAVASGVEAGLVDPDRIAFLGASYGGYVSLLAACTRPDLVRCAVAISAPCDLVSFIREPPPYWQPLLILLRRQILNSRTGQQLDEETLEARSPMHALDDACAPVLLVHGVRDPRVAVAEVDKFVDRARRLEVPVRFLRFEDEGHHVKSNANREILFKEIEDFLEEHLAAH